MSAHFRHFRAIVALAFALPCALAASQAYAANDWVTQATISPTTTLQKSRLCYTDGRDLACNDNSGGLLTTSATIHAGAFVGDGSGLTGVVASSGDRIVSNTTSMVADGATGYISITQAGFNTAYFQPSRGLVTVGISTTGPISATNAYIRNKVGIGYSNPTEALQVNGNIYGNGSIAASRFSLPGWFNYLGGNTSQNYLTLVTSNTEAVRIVSNSNVGIGTTKPTTKLEVNGTISATNFVGNGSGLTGIAATDLYDLTHVSASTSVSNLFLGSTSGATAGTTNTTAVGIGTFGAGTNSGDGNTALGARTLYKNTSGQANTAVGNYALSNNTSGIYNTATGSSALQTNSTGIWNTATGKGSLNTNSTGNNNTAVGAYALEKNTTSNENTALGAAALSKNITGANNVATGAFTMRQNTTGSANTATGNYALHYNQAGTNNTAVGFNSLFYAAPSNNSVAIGYASGQGVASTTTFQNGTFLGSYSGFNITTGNSNTLVGYRAGYSLSSGSNNIALGAGTTFPSATGNNQLNIGNTVYGDLSTKRIGIGNTSPTTSLQVTRGSSILNYTPNGRTVGLFENNASTGSAIDILSQATGASSIFFSKPGSMGSASLSYDHPLNVMKFFVAGQTRGAWTSSGFLIGNTISSTAPQTASATLHVLGTALTTSWTGINFSSAANVVPTAPLEVSGTVSATRFVGDGSALTNLAAGDLYTLTHVSATEGSINSLYLGTTTGAGNAGIENTSIGIQSMANPTNTGQGNTAVGFQALSSNTTAKWNSAFGRKALQVNTTGNYNTAIGAKALSANIGGYSNVAVGMNAIEAASNGLFNSVIGRQAFAQATALQDTVAVGYRAGWGTAATSLTAGTILGSQAGYSLTTGNSNTLVGYKAGYSLSSGSNNIALGAGTTFPSATGNNQLNIGNTVYGDLSTKRIGIGKTNPAYALEVSGSVSATKFYGDGSALTNLAAGDLYALTHVSASAVAGNLFVGDTTGAQAGTSLTTTLGIGVFGAGTNTGRGNTAMGYAALYSNTTGKWNVAIGQSALYSNTGGNYNVASGLNALYNTTTGSQNIASGNNTLYYNTGGSWNVALGQNALYYNSASYNVGIGLNAINNNVLGANNAAVGSFALRYANPVSYTVAIGYAAAQGVSGSSTFKNGTFLGANSGYSITTGDDNTFIGANSGYSITSGANNIAIGKSADFTDPTASNQLNIGNTVYGDLSTKRIGIGKSLFTPSATLHVSGTVRLSGSSGAETCASTNNYGTLRINPSTGKLQICRQ